jgi:pimeloyl-ACP methyl ester carboxylesterase/DNA-binding CsgD family transcriptional regulator
MYPSPLRYARTSDGVNIAFLELGDGPPLVFASQMYGEAYFYRRGWPYVSEIVDRLLDAGWRVILYDIRGMGASDSHVDDLGLQARVRDLEAVVAALGLERFALAGNDLAGVTAIAYAAQHPDKVSRLLLLEPWASGHQKYALPAVRLMTSIDPSAGDEWSVWSHVLGNIVTGFQPELGKQLAQAIQEGATPAQFAAYVRSTEEIDVSDLLPQVTAPTLVVHMSNLATGSYDLAREVAAGILNARFLETQTSQYWPAVKAFLLGDPDARVAAASGIPLAASALSRRQAEVLRLIAAGRTNREIADDLTLSLRTVERHVADLYDRLGVRNRAEAVAIGLSIDATART